MKLVRSAHLYVKNRSKVQICIGYELWFEVRPCRPSYSCLPADLSLIVTLDLTIIVTLKVAYTPTQTNPSPLRWRYRGTRGVELGLINHKRVKVFRVNATARTKLS
jgi:hypothetical protein